jgi:hypothetical protein
LVAASVLLPESAANYFENEDWICGWINERPNSEGWICVDMASLQGVLDVTRWAVACRRFYTARDWSDARGWGSNQAFRNSRVAPVSRGVLIYSLQSGGKLGWKQAALNAESPFQPAFSHHHEIFSKW